MFYIGINQKSAMREFVFAIQYEPESDPVMDVFIDHPELAYVLA